MSEAEYDRKTGSDPSARVQCVARPLTVAEVVRAIRAVDDEAARRGSMFPQTADEQ
jgi:hypothetical protein